MAVVLIPLIIVAGYVVLYQSAPVPDSNGVSYSSFSVSEKTFKLTYLATNRTDRQNGLMNTKVDNDTTMLFVFPSSDYYPFWMFGVNSSLDIIWIDAGTAGGIGSVVYMVQDAPPCHVEVACTNYEPTARANLVLETKGGFASANGIVVGTTIVFK